MQRRLLDGVFINELDGCNIIEIKEFSDELKNKIKDELTVICHGECALSGITKYYSFEKTILELVNYRLSSDRKKRVGAIGELLLNVIIRMLGELEIVSPFFNMEERNVKKGFDIIACDVNNGIWIIESKAGEVGADSNSSKKVEERINEAKRDLQDRLNDEKAQLWLNAINSVRTSIGGSDEKKVVLKILGELSNTSVSTDKNVILGGTVFCSFDSDIEEAKVIDIYGKIRNQQLFSNVQIIAIKKKTIEAVVEFLSGLAEVENEKINIKKII